MSLKDLLDWNRLTGDYYGSEDQSIFFYSYTKMQRPETILELGTGLGHTSLWIAEALKSTGHGHVWTVDNGARWPQVFRHFRNERNRPDQLNSPSLFEGLFDSYFLDPSDTDEQSATSYFSCLQKLAEVLGLNPFVTFLKGTLSLTDTTALSPTAQPFLKPALKKPIDLLYADFDHYPHAILTLITKVLPLMSECSSIFIDSASTYLPTYLALERTIDQLNNGKLPAIFFAGTTNQQQRQLRDIVSKRRFTFIALPEKKDRNQNGLAWIRIEPVNIVPYPLTQTRGLFASPVSSHALESLFHFGSLPQDQVHSAFLFEQFVRSAYLLSEEELKILLGIIAGRDSCAR